MSERDWWLRGHVSAACRGTARLSVAVREATSAPGLD